MSNDEFSRKYFQPTVNKYLSTVLCIDDQFEENNKNINSEKKLLIPQQGNVKVKGSAIVREENRTVDINQLVDAFSEKGLLLTPLNPLHFYRSHNTDFFEKIIFLAQKADVIIIDWKMKIHGFSDESDFAKEIIKKLSNDKKYHLIIIYSAEKSEDIKQELSQNKNYESVDIIPYCKSSIDQKNHRTYPELANQIVKDFMASRKGILSAALIAYLEIIRESSSSMLNRIEKDFDRALLCHRILLDAPDKVKDFISELVQDEILGFANYDVVKKLGDLDCMLKYSKEFPNSYSHIKKDGKEINEEKLELLLKNGYKTGEVFSKNSSKSIMKIVGEEENYLQKFSEYTMMISSEVKPNLKNGCIVKNGDNYLLCLQPLCDSERISQKDKDSIPKNFIFLEMKENDNPDLFVENVGLKIIYSSICTFSFYGNEKGVVDMDNENIFLGHSILDEKDLKLKYIACLKPMVAQKFSNNFAANISRVGIDQFEWLRLKGKE